MKRNESHARKVLNHKNKEVASLVELKRLKNILSPRKEFACEFLGGSF